MARPLQHRLRPAHSRKARINLRLDQSPRSTDSPARRPASRPPAHPAQVVHVHPERPRRRHPSRRRVRLLQQPLVGQLHHLVPHRRRAQPRPLASTRLQPRHRPRDRPRTYRLARFNIAFDDGRQDRPLPRRYPLRLRHAHHLSTYFIPSVNLSRDCADYPPSNLAPGTRYRVSSPTRSPESPRSPPQSPSPAPPPSAPPRRTALRSRSLFPPAPPPLPRRPHAA